MTEKVFNSDYYNLENCTLDGIVGFLTHDLTMGESFGKMKTRLPSKLFPKIINLFFETPGPFKYNETGDYTCISINNQYIAEKEFGLLKTHYEIFGIIYGCILQHASRKYDMKINKFTIASIIIEHTILHLHYSLNKFLSWNWHSLHEYRLQPIMSCLLCTPNASQGCKDSNANYTEQKEEFIENKFNHYFDMVSNFIHKNSHNEQDEAFKKHALFEHTDSILLTFQNHDSHNLKQIKIKTKLMKLFYKGILRTLGDQYFRVLYDML